MRSALAASRTRIAASRAWATMGSGDSIGDLHNDETYDAEDDAAQLGGGDGVDRDDDSKGWYESVGDDVPVALSVSMVLIVSMMVMSCKVPSSRSHPRGARSASKSTTGRSTTLARELGMASAPNVRPRPRPSLKGQTTRGRKQPILTSCCFKTTSK